MQTVHPRRRRAITYFLIPMLLIGTVFAAGITGAHMQDQNSRAAHVLGTISGVSVIFAFIFTVPFFIYAVRYWRLKIVPATLPPADATPHDLPIQYSTSPLSALFGNVFSRVGHLTWVNSDKTITLTREKNGNTTTFFKVAFKDVQKLEVSLNMLGIRVAGKTYRCFAYSGTIVASTVVGAAEGSQLATIALGSNAFTRAGVPELAERLQLEGVDVITTNLGRLVELGLDWGFAVLFLGAAFVIAFITR